MQQRKGRGRGSLLLAALAFLLQITAWAWSPAMAGMIGPAGNWVEICTADGLTTVAVDADADADKAPVVKNMGCPLCPLVAGLALPPHEPAVSVPVTLSRHMPQSLPGGQIAAGWFLATLQARAPPAAV